MENKYSYIILRKASQDLEEIFKYISIDLSNQCAAKKLISEFLEAFERICLFPFSCQLIDEPLIKEKDIRRLIVDNYVVFYKVVGFEIQIIRIRHATSNYQNKI